MLVSRNHQLSIFYKKKKMDDVLIPRWFTLELSKLMTNLWFEFHED